MGTLDQDIDDLIGYLTLGIGDGVTDSQRQMFIAGAIVTLRKLRDDAPGLPVADIPDGMEEHIDKRTGEVTLRPKRKKKRGKRIPF